MKKIDEKLKFEGIIIDVYKHVYETDSKHLNIEYVKHPGGVCVAAQDSNGLFYMVKQFRFGAQRMMIEFPAGLIDEGEDPSQTAIRELREEIGYEAKKIVSLGEIDLSPGYLAEKSYLYFADDLHYVGQDWDENENLEVIMMPLDEIIELGMKNEMTDAKTLVLAYKLRDHLSQ